MCKGINMNVVTLDEVKSNHKLSVYEVKQLTEALKSIQDSLSHDIYNGVIDGDYYDSCISPFIEYRQSVLKTGYKKSPFIKYENLTDIAERTSDLISFARLVSDHIIDSSELTGGGSSKSKSMSMHISSYKNLRGKVGKYTKKLDDLRNYLVGLGFDVQKLDSEISEEEK